jgi:drug/metabolite transporter (DMT)-like permease
MKGAVTLTVLVLVFGLVLNSIGNGLLSTGMRRAEVILVIAGVGLQALFFASYLFALSRADLSFVLPITAIDYLLTALIAGLVLGERPPPVRWAGIALIALGVALVLSSPRASGE